MKSNLLKALQMRKIENTNQVEIKTSEEYEGMIVKGNELIREKQQGYYEAYNNALKVSVG